MIIVKAVIEVNYVEGEKEDGEEVEDTVRRAIQELTDSNAWNVDEYLSADSVLLDVTSRFDPVTQQRLPFDQRGEQEDS